MKKEELVKEKKGGEQMSVDREVRMSRKWIVVYSLIGVGSLVSYFIIRPYLITTGVTPFVLSNLTLNLLLLTMTWGAVAPRLLKHYSPISRWLLVFAGFILIIVILTITGTHTRLTELLKGVVK